MTASGRISGGVPIQESTVGTIRKATVPVSMEDASMMYAELAIALRTRSSFRAPKYWAVTMLQPPLMPLKMEKNRNEMDPVAPTAARALAPRSRPTIMESARLYACWNRLPIRSGSAKTESKTSGLPSVMFIVEFLRMKSSPQAAAAYRRRL